MTQAADQPVSSLSDAALIEAVRAGSSEAFGRLYERHLAAARRASTYLAKSDAEREDVVSEAFARVFRVLRAGKGPSEEFRPYLLRAMRNIAINTTRRQSPLSPVADMEVFDSPEETEDPVVAGFHRGVIARAFISLPERWRTVLWHTEVEGESPAAVAPLLGMSPNAVAALAHRAREGLSRAYLQMHLPAPERSDCRASRAKLGAYIRGSMTDAELRRIGDHLDGCDRCRALAAGLTEINDNLRVILAPLVLGIPLAAAYLSKSPAAAGTLAASAKAAPASAKSGGVVGQLVAKVALVAVAMGTLAGAAARPEPANDVAMAPQAPRITAPRQPSVQPPAVPPSGPTSTPEPTPAPPTTTAPRVAGTNAVPPAPATPPPATPPPTTSPRRQAAPAKPESTKERKPGRVTPPPVIGELPVHGRPFPGKADGSRSVPPHRKGDHRGK